MLKSILYMITLFASSAFGMVDTDDLRKATVMITNKGESGGGSGVILKSTSEKSTILTNGHVCEVVKKGGLVHSVKGKTAVERYTKSEQHDLCLIEVIEDLGIDSEIASSAPTSLDLTYVAGHPFLYPTMITEGHFGSSMIIRIMLGIKGCTKEDIKKNGFYCWTYGGLPIIRELNTNIVSNLVAPGNSGSAVYNNSGKIIGLIFAGSGRGMSPGIIVPFEYIKSFVDIELKGSKLKPVETAVAKTVAELDAEEDAAFRVGTAVDIRNIGNLKNLVFPAIKDGTLDLIETKLRTCVKTEEGGCLNFGQ